MTQKVFIRQAVMMDYLRSLIYKEKPEMNSHEKIQHLLPVESIKF